MTACVRLKYGLQTIGSGTTGRNSEPTTSSLLTSRRAGQLSFLCGLTLCSLSILVRVLFALLAVSFRLFDLDVRPPARPPVFLPPGVQGRRSAVHGSLHKAKVGLAVLTGSVALPPVLPVHVDLIVETVVDL